MVTGFNFSQGSPCAWYMQFDWRDPALHCFNVLPSPSSEKAPVPSLRSSCQAQRGAEHAVPSFWLPDNVLTVTSVEPFSFLRLSNVPWSPKYYRTSHCPTFQHTIALGSVCIVGQDLMGLSGGWGALPPVPGASECFCSYSSISCHCILAWQFT